MEPARSDRTGGTGSPIARSTRAPPFGSTESDRVDSRASNSHTEFWRALAVETAEYFCSELVCACSMRAHAALAKWRCFWGCRGVLIRDTIFRCVRRDAG